MSDETIEYQDSVSRITSGNSTYYLADIQARDAIQTLSKYLDKYTNDTTLTISKIDNLENNYQTYVEEQLKNLQLPLADYDTNGSNLDKNSCAIWIEKDYSWRIKD